MSFVVIDRPSGSGTNNVFRPSGGMTGCSGGTGPLGFICANGTTNPKGGEEVQTVHAKIFPAGTSSWPANPPAGIVQVNLSGQRDWAFDSTMGTPDVPCARCGPNAGAAIPNVLVVWATYPTQGPESVSVAFNGVCASATDCGGESMSVSQTYSLTMPMRAARAMRVEATGFSAEALQPFNGAWNLNQSQKVHGAWDNGGDGKKSVRVELRLDIKEPAAWQLTFKLGRAKAVYAQSNVNWGWSRANDLLFIGADAKKKGAPAVVRATPA